MWVEGAGRATFDVRDADACRRHAEGVRAIVHCAAVVGPARSRVDPQVTLAVNVNGTANLLEAAHANGARLVNVSTATLYGNRPDMQPLHETDPADPLTVYDGTKLMGETWCAAHRRTYGSDCASFRTGFVYGRGNQIGEYFLPRVLAGERVEERRAAATPATSPMSSTSLRRWWRGACRQPAARGSTTSPAACCARGRNSPTRCGRWCRWRTSCRRQDRSARHLRGACVLDRARADLGWTPRFDIEQGRRLASPADGLATDRWRIAAAPVLFLLRR